MVTIRLGRLWILFAEKKTARGKRLKILRFHKIDDYQSCDILFVSKNVSSTDVAALVRTTGQQGVLLVGERLGFLAEGGIINFYIDGAGKTAIQLDPDAARKRRLHIDARLMRICEITSSRVVGQ